MPADLIRTIEHVTGKIKANGLIVFAGAGFSATPPSCIPGWYALNAMILQALRNRVTRYLGRDRKWLEKVMRGAIERRNSGLFPPEYQAQVMEEQCGLNYFRALSAVDTDQLNRVHKMLSSIAAGGCLKGVVSTNFDRLIEKSISSDGLIADVAYDMDGFNRLSEDIRAGKNSAASLKVLKVHGCALHPESMIDTLQQRLTGRADLLKEVMVSWLSQHFVIYAGFSASDLNHSPDYLGLCESAKNSPGALFILYPGARIERGAAALMEAYGERLFFIESKLWKVFQPLTRSLGGSSPGKLDKTVHKPRAAVRNYLDRWASSLDPYEAINMITSLFNAGGDENAAFEVLKKAWKSRLSLDSKGAHFARFQYNYAKQCLQSGEMLYEETPQNFIRSKNFINYSDAGLMEWLLYRGRSENMMPQLIEAVGLAKGAGDIRSVFEYGHTLGRYAVVYHDFGVFEHLLDTAGALRKAGDLPHSVRIWTLAAMLIALSGKGKYDVDGLFEHAGKPAIYLGDEVANAELHLAVATDLIKRGVHATAGYPLGTAINIFRRFQRWPQLIEGLILGFSLKMSEKDYAGGRQLFDEASGRVSKGYEIYNLPLALALADFYAVNGHPERAAEEAERVRPLAVSTQHVRALGCIDEFVEKAKNALPLKPN